MRYSMPELPCDFENRGVSNEASLRPLFQFETEIFAVWLADQVDFGK